MRAADRGRTRLEDGVVSGQGTGLSPFSGVVIRGQFLVQGVAMNSHGLGGLGLIPLVFFQSFQDKLLLELGDRFLKEKPTLNHLGYKRF